MSDSIPFWEHIHGASTHFPIAMMFASFAFDFGALIFRRPQWRVVAFWTLIVAAVLCVPAVLSGLTGMLGWFHVDPYMGTPSKTMLLHRNLALIGERHHSRDDDLGAWSVSSESMRGIRLLF